VIGLFVPGWGATPGLYLAGLPEGWEALELPSFRSAGGDFGAYRRWLADEIARRPAPIALAGHSMGGTLALLEAAEQPELVEQVILLSPAGLPLTKPMRSSVRAFARQVLRGCYPPGELGRMVTGAVAAPRSALKLARTVHGLDLAPELERIRAAGVPCTIVACAGDDLTTCAHCRALAAALDADYREIEAADGHIWPVTQPELLARELGAATPTVQANRTSSLRV
jgi:pimeloyl-ACP methyl ester carboxylesterase